MRTTDGVTEPFTTKTGVRQGCVLSPILFNVYIDRIIKETQNEIYNETTENEQLNNELNELLFADDQSIIYDDEEKLQTHINSLSRICNKYNMRINTQKTETMQITRSTEHFKHPN